MYVLPTEPRLCLFFWPKTGTRSAERAIRDISVNYRRCVKGRHGIDVAKAEEVRDEGGVVAGMVRQPVDLVVSWYHYQYVKRPRERPPFGEWLDKFLVEGQKRWVLPRGRLFYNAELLTHPMRFESGVGVELNRVLTLVGLGPVEVDTIGKAEDRTHWKQYYDREQYLRVVERFPQDQELWESLS